MSYYCLYFYSYSNFFFKLFFQKYDIIKRTIAVLSIPPPYGGGTRERLFNTSFAIIVAESGNASLAIFLLKSCSFSGLAIVSNATGSSFSFRFHILHIDSCILIHQRQRILGLMVFGHIG